MNKHESFWTDLHGGEFKQGYLQAGDVRTRYLHAGDASLPPLLLLHGVGGHAETYSRNLIEHAEHFNTYSIDMVGHGYSSKPDYDYEVDVYVEHLRAVIDTLGFDKICLSGESLGGWVAARFALKYPERLKRMVLNTCGGATLNPEVMQRIKSLTMAAVREPDWDTVKARLEWLMADPATVTNDLVACRQAIYKQPGMVEAMQRIMCLQETEIRQRNNLSDAEWAAIKTETLVLWTDKDPTAAVEVGEKIATLIPNGRFALMKNCGHWPQFEDPPTFNKIHLDFLLQRN
ncbi:MAG: 2-hydroxy-6-oxonona-2,4-dienedioate hydrolase [Gammaproteobacteria bacterium]|jgi:2-hydroxy-6-oxonona-2,4-dienedioate hydrolase